MSGEAQGLSQILQIDVGQAEGLLRKRDVLKALLSELHDVLIEEKKGSTDEIAISLENQRNLNDSLEQAKRQTRKKKDEVNELDISEPTERLDTTGTDSIQEATWTLRNPKSKIKFHLNTSHPIRDVRFNHSESARVKRQSWTGGGTALIAEVKSKKRFTNINARVELYGWPREIHQHELAKKHEELHRLTLDEGKIRKQLGLVNSALQKLESTDKAYEEASKQCSGDLKKVENLGTLGYVDSKKLALYIATDSIYGLAILLKLTSMVSISSPLAHGIDTRLAWPLLQGQIEVLRTMQVHVDKVSRMVSEIAQKKDNTEAEFQDMERALLTDVLWVGANQTAFNDVRQKIEKSDHDIADDEQNTLNQKSCDAVAKLQTDLEVFQEKKGALFSRSREDRLEQFREVDCRVEAREATDEVNLDCVTNEAVRKMLSADRYHVGILATVKSSQTTAEAVGCVWRAERLRLANTRNMLPS